MPRTARIAFEDGFFHVYNRGLAKQSIFVENTDYSRFIKKLAELKSKSKYDHIIYSYVLLPNYFHLLIQTHKTPLATIMGSLLTSYSMYFNIKYKRSGPLFQGRFRSKLCDKQTYFLGASRYIHLNPIREGLVSDLKDYPWSSYGEIFDISSHNIVDKEELKKIIGRKNKNLDSYRQFVLDGIKIINDLPSQYSFKKQVEGEAKFNVMIQKRYQRQMIARRINRLFRIGT